jgi:hypothetical protein
MQDFHKGTKFLSNDKSFLDGVSKGVSLVNDSSIRPLDLIKSSHPCYSHELTVIDDDADDLESDYDSKSQEITATANEFVSFYFMNKNLPEGAYFDDTLIKQNGAVITDILRGNIHEDATMTIEYGFIYDKDENEIGRIQDAFLAWKNRQA